LAASQRWGRTFTVAVGAIHLSTNRIRIELCCPGLGGESALLEMVYREDRLSAAWARAGWLAGLEGARASAWDDALAGFLCLTGVETVAEPESGGERVRAVVPLPWAEWVQRWERDRAGVQEGVLPGPALPRG
jgi:hypothetical protein